MEQKQDNKTLNTMLSETLKKMDPSVLATVLTSSKRSRNDCDSDENDIKEQPKKAKAKNENLKEEQRGPINEYSGWVVPDKNFTIPSIPINNLSPEKFYEEYVKQRRPVVLNGNLDDLDGLQKWKNNNNHIRSLAGKQKVMVEVRTSDSDPFGRGNEIDMSFNHFLDLIEKGDTKHYLTTQDVEANEDGQPYLMAPFMKTLKDDFPLRPKIIGNLIPQNINLWLGNNKDGASSGLHHDYHDNLYIVLRGKKKFRLYSPNDTENLYSRGKICRVHPNGRINYEGEETTAYGADLQADAAAKAALAKEAAEQRLIEAEKSVEEGIPGAEEELEKAEEMLEQAMDALIDVEMGSDTEEFGDDEEDDKIDEEAFRAFNEEEEEEVSNCLVDKTVKDPNNFSKVAAEILLDEVLLHERFPDMKTTKAAFCELSVGDVLYLPASWWHEVISFSGSEGHLAMNYWFHPPDASNDFDHPYSTDFWPNDYKLRFTE